MQFLIAIQCYFQEFSMSARNIFKEIILDDSLGKVKYYAAPILRK